MTAIAQDTVRPAPTVGKRPVLRPLFVCGALALLTPIAVALPITLLRGRPLPWQFQVPWAAPHIAVAVLVVVLGGLQLALRKGDRRHRLVGYAWCGLMAFISVSGFLIRLKPGPMTLIHMASSAFAVLNLICLPLLIWGARTGHRKLHKVVALVMFANLLSSGAQAYIPFRAIGLLVFGALH